MRLPATLGLSAEQVPVSAYGGSLKNLKDLKEGCPRSPPSPGTFMQLKILPYRGYLAYKKPPPPRTTIGP